MKKIIGLLIVLAIFIGGSWGAYNYFYGGSPYYTKIVTNGEKEVGHDSSTGEGYNVYVYNQKAYDKNGGSKKVTLREQRDRPLKMNAYLKLSVNPRKGVVAWEEVTQKDVPEAALNKLE